MPEVLLEYPNLIIHTSQLPSQSFGQSKGLAHHIK